MSNAISKAFRWTDILSINFVQTDVLFQKFILHRNRPEGLKYDNEERCINIEQRQSSTETYQAHTDGRYRHVQLYPYSSPKLDELQPRTVPAT